MPDHSPLLALPLIQPAQAQKHVTHNAAIDRLDVLVQLVVEAFDATTPPVAPDEGAVWALGVAPTEAWAAHPGHLASWRGGAWAFVAPLPGWRAALPTGGLRVFAGGVWAGPLAAGDLQNLAGVGINAASDAINRLAVAAPATLLSHEGAGHQLKINKAAPGDTASLLFQSGWSGRAEMGLAGSDDFALKVSADGTAFATAISVTGATGAVSLPAGLRLPDGTAAAPGLSFAGDDDTGLRRPAADQIGLVTGGTQRALLGSSGFQINVPLIGTAVTQTSTDTTAGRLMKIGDFGLGVTGSPPGLSSNADDTTWPSGFYRLTTLATGTLPPGFNSTSCNLRVERYNPDVFTQTVWRHSLLDRGIWMRTCNLGVFSPWVQVGAAGIVGTVAQTSGVVTGAIIERGSNANGAYARFADGTMRCVRHGLSVASAATAEGALFRSNDLSVTFASAFAESPVVTGQADDIDCWLTFAAPGTTGCTLRVKSALAKTGTVALRLVAQGRWF